MVTYDLINELKSKGLFQKCITTGIIPFTYSNWCDIYEYYKNESKTVKSKMQCYTNTASHFEVHENTVMNIVSKLEY